MINLTQHFTIKNVYFQHAQHKCVAHHHYCIFTEFFKSAFTTSIGPHLHAHPHHRCEGRPFAATQHPLPAAVRVESPEHPLLYLVVLAAASVRVEHRAGRWHGQFGGVGERWWWWWWHRVAQHFSHCSRARDCGSGGGGWGEFICRFIHLACRRSGLFEQCSDRFDLSVIPFTPSTLL